MLLRDRKDCTLEALVPRALAIHSSLLPSSTQRFTSSMYFLSETLWFMPTLPPPQILLIVQVCYLTYPVGAFPAWRGVRSRLGSMDTFIGVGVEVLRLVPLILAFYV